MQNDSRNLHPILRGACFAAQLLTTLVLGAATSFAAPIITQMRPATGAAAGGNLVLLTGSGFDPAGTVQVTFGGQPAAGIDVTGDTQLLCVTPNHVPGDVTLEVKNGDSSTVTQVFTFEPATDLYLAPQAVAAAGGYYSVFGSDFVEGMKLIVGFTDPEHPSANVQLPSEWTQTQLTAYSGSAAVGNRYNIALEYPDARKVTLPGNLHIVSALPKIKTLTPDHGSVDGGTRVYIEGQNIIPSPWIQVLFDGVPGSDVQYDNTVEGGTYISCLSPPHAQAKANVTLRNPDGGVTAKPSTYVYMDYPDADPCATSEDIAPTGSFTTFAASTLGSSSCGGYGVVRWFKLTCPADGTLTLSTCNTPEEPHATLAIFDACGGAGNELTCSVYACAYEAEIVDFPVTACTTYYVQVGSVSQETFWFTLNSQFQASGVEQLCGVSPQEVDPCLELVRGGDMEFGGDGNWGAFADASIDDDPANAYDGTRAAKLACQGEYITSMFWTPVHLEEGAKATIQFARKLDLVSGGGGKFQVYLDSAVDLKNLVYEENFVDSEYQIVSVEVGQFTEIADVALVFTSSIDDINPVIYQGYAWVDDISFVICPAGPRADSCEDRTPDGDFERSIGEWNTTGTAARAAGGFQGDYCIGLWQDYSALSSLNRSFPVNAGESATLNFARTMGVVDGTPDQYRVTLKLNSGAEQLVYHEAFADSDYAPVSVPLGPFAETGVATLTFYSGTPNSYFRGELDVDSVEIIVCPEVGEGEGEPLQALQTADQNSDRVIQLTELLRVIQFYNSHGLQCADFPTDTEDGFVPGAGENHACLPHNLDYSPQDWRISLAELLRLIQFYNSPGYHYCPLDATEDGYCLGL